MPGANIAIIKEGKIIYSEGFGLASKDLEVPVTRATRFRIGEVTEIFTSLLYHLLAENGTLNPDSTVQTYLPDFTEKKYKLTLRHLVNHTSGIREPVHEEKEWRGLNISIRKGIETFSDDSLIAAPGTLQIPSMFNYNLPGAVMEECTGTPFSILLKEYLTDTLQLKHTLIDNPFATIPGRADFFDHNFITQIVHATFRDMRYRAPSEGMVSNAEDLALLGNELIRSDYIPEHVLKKLFEPVKLKGEMTGRMTNGWILFEDRNGHIFYGRSGSVTGGSAAIFIHPKEELVVACATNLGILSEDLPVYPIMSHLLPSGDEQ